MPSEYPQSQSQSHSQVQTPQRSTTSISSSTAQSDSPSTSPHQQGKPKKHVVHHHHHSSSRIHTRVPSSKGLHKLTKAHGIEGSHTDLQSRRNASATNLRKNTSNVSLKRNRSAAEVSKKSKAAASTKEKEKDKERKANTSVHFEIGDQDDGAWEEASSSASPALSRAPSRSGQSSTKLSANNSQPTSPLPQSPQTQDLPPGNGSRSHNADAKIITERLLQRTPSHNTTKMSLATATPTNLHSPSSSGKRGSSTLNETPKIGSKEDVVSRFVSGSGTPSENSPYLNQHRQLQDLSLPKHDEVKRAKSMGNLTRHDSSPRESDEDESALAPRSRKSSTTHAYNPPQQSRTQQKLWLQRASSNMEHTQIAPGVPMNGLSIHHHVGFGNTPLVGASYDGKDPRIKVQLEKTGLEYLVVRRHKDPVGLALKRLNKLPGAERYRHIPPQLSHRSTKSDSGGSVGRYGLSQSLKDARGGSRATTSNGSYDGQNDSDGDMRGMSGVRDEDDTVSNILRGMWDKSFDLSASAD